MKIFKCNICGNIVELIEEGGGELVCCGEPMELMTEKVTEEGNEKHLPVAEIKDNVVTVKVGSVEHPMIDAHYIQWITVKYNNKKQTKRLFPNELPVAKFIIDEDFDKIEIYEYCNIHGLWKSEFRKEDN